MGMRRLEEGRDERVRRERTEKKKGEGGKIGKWNSAEGKSWGGENGEGYSMTVLFMTVLLSRIKEWAPGKRRGEGRDGVVREEWGREGWKKVRMKG